MHSMLSQLKPLGRASFARLRLLHAGGGCRMLVLAPSGRPVRHEDSGILTKEPRGAAVTAAAYSQRSQAPLSSDDQPSTSYSSTNYGYRQGGGGNGRGRGSSAAGGRGRAPGRGSHTGRSSHDSSRGNPSYSIGSGNSSREASSSRQSWRGTSGAGTGREQLAESSNGRQPSVQQGNRTTVLPGSDSDSALLPHRRRAAARAAQAALTAAPTPPPQQQLQAQAAGDVPQATFVPRDPRAKDGPWTKLDAALVTDAQQDATAAVAPTTIDANGFVLLGKSEQELRAFAESQGQPAYRGKQLLDGLLRGARSVADMPTVPKEWREQLQAAGVRTGRSIVQHSVVAKDGTQKMLLQLADGRVIETVGIPVDDEQKSRLTVCVSSQVGCPMRCSFCATGKGGFARNLMPHEIVDQVMTVQETFGKRVSNIVFMGMGEPLLNLPSVVAAYKYLNTQLGIGGRGITISTVGVPNAIPKLAQYDLAATLAVSIHAPNQELREQLIPSAKVYPLSKLMDDCVSYFQSTKRRVSYEYTLMAGVNDEPKHAQELADLLRSRDLASHVNIIPWNPVDESDYRRPTSRRVAAFKDVLEAAGLPVSVRSSRGLDAAAACGQLRNMHQKMPMESFSVPA